MEKYSSAVSEMYSQFKKKEPHPLDKYIGRRVVYWGKTREVVGYFTWSDGSFGLIADASADDGWEEPGENDVIVKTCGYYLYVSIKYLID